jgi:hypothetical protein
MLDGKELAKALGEQYVKLRKTHAGGRAGGRPKLYDHTKPDCPCVRCQRKRKREAKP